MHLSIPYAIRFKLIKKVASSCRFDGLVGFLRFQFRLKRVARPNDFVQSIAYIRLWDAFNMAIWRDGRQKQFLAIRIKEN